MSLEALFLLGGVVPRGDYALTSFTETGYSTFTVPDGVYSVCVVCLGSGASGGADLSGGGGALAWKNDIPVTPGDIIEIDYGDDRQGGTTAQEGNYSRVRHAASNTDIQAEGGSIGYAGLATYSGADGGGYGGAPALTGSGGGGAGGYTGSGGSGRNSGSSYGSGGGGGSGHSGSTSVGGGGGGGGVYFDGPGSSGAGGSYDGAGGKMSGRGVTHGSDGSVSSFGTREGGGGGVYGGGGGSGHDVGGNGARGFVRILWGEGRYFPSTDVRQD